MDRADTQLGHRARQVRCLGWASEWARPTSSPSISTKTKTPLTARRRRRRVRDSILGWRGRDTLPAREPFEWFMRNARSLRLRRRSAKPRQTIDIWWMRNSCIQMQLAESWGGAPQDLGKRIFDRPAERRRLIVIDNRIGCYVSVLFQANSRNSRRLISQLMDMILWSSQLGDSRIQCHSVAVSSWADPLIRSLGRLPHEDLLLPGELCPGKLIVCWLKIWKSRLHPAPA